MAKKNQNKNQLAEFIKDSASRAKKVSFTRQLEKLMDKIKNFNREK